jgi:3-phenylpropionate/cinnamic acid dioxygenase small subunit
MERIEAFLYREAELLDTAQLDEWLSLFTADGIYWVPIDDRSPAAGSVSIIYDDRLGREERVHHAQHLTSPSQSPRSRTVHCVSNVRVAAREGAVVDVNCNQVIYETRGGDHSQVGLGQMGTHVASVSFRLRLGEDIRILLKKVVLLNRDQALGNLTFML